jgi:hypothetical protein
MNGIGEGRGESVGGCDAVSPAEGESQTDGWWAGERHPPAIHGSIIKDQKKRIMGRRDRGDNKGVCFAPFSPYLFMNFVSKLESSQES